MSYGYTQSEFDAYGWSTLSRCELAPAETYGLDYESARESTPRWYGVSSGNGNDGVSQMFPNYYCRCNASEAFDLAAAAMLAEFKPEGYQWAADAITIDGESDYTISAVIYDPPEDETEEESWSQCSACENPESCRDNMVCDLGEISETEELKESWCDANGAWLIVEVFPVDDDELPDAGDPWRKATYQSLSDAFDSELLTMARAV